MGIPELAEKIKYKFRKYDECGDRVIEGKRGNIHKDGKKFSAWVFFPSARSLNLCHEAFKFAKRTQNGDADAVYQFDGEKIGETEIAALVKFLKIRLKNKISPENAQKAADRLAAIRSNPH